MKRFALALVLVMALGTVVAAQDVTINVKIVLKGEGELTAAEQLEYLNVFLAGKNAVIAAQNAADKDRNEALWPSLEAYLEQVIHPAIHASLWPKVKRAMNKRFRTVSTAAVKAEVAKVAP